MSQLEWMSEWEYLNYVDSLCGNILDEVKERIESGDIQPDEWVEVMNEWLEGLDTLIYTWKAKQIVLWSDNCEAIGECYDSFMVNDSIPWEAMAYFALQTDIMERINIDELIESYSEPAEDPALAETAFLPNPHTPNV